MPITIIYEVSGMHNSVRNISKESFVSAVIR